MKLSARSIYPGVSTGEALVSPVGISFFGGVDPDSGVVVERGHPLEGLSVSGRVLVFPSGKGSTVGSYTLYRLKAAGNAPLAIVNAACETITAVGCIIAEIPCVDQVDLTRLRTGQRLRVDAGLGVVEILSSGGDDPSDAGEDGRPAAFPQPPAPLPDPLRGSEPGSFAEDTLSRRLPDIARRAADAWDWPAAARRRLLALTNELPHASIAPLDDPGAPDLPMWLESMRPWYGETWLHAPWLAAEVYFFRRLLAASGYFQAGPAHGVDPYRGEKDEALRRSVQPLTEAIAALEGRQRQMSPAAALEHLLRSVIWGNQADLSLWPAGETGPEASSAEHLVIDHAVQAAGYLAALQGRGLRLDLVFDNAGLELAYDLLLIDFLFENGMAGSITAHVRPFPTYVSDVTVLDLHAALDAYAAADNPALCALAGRLQARLKPGAAAQLGPEVAGAGRLRVTTDLHWVGPSPNWQMPAALRRELAGSALVISKGDMNYRRWLGDLHWPFTAGFDAITAYRPAPILALRVMKSNELAGLPTGREETLNARDSDWLYNGRWGIIQFSNA